MTHYSREKWRSFKLGRLPVDERRAMEEHLYSCDRCLSFYLATVERRDEELAELLLPPDFTERVLGGLPAGSRRRSSGQWKSLLLQYYAVAAAITLFLLASGWFEAVTQKIPRTMEQTGLVTRRVEEHLPFGWSERLTNFASSRIDLLLAGKEGSR